MSHRRNQKGHGVRLHIQVFRDVLDSPQYAVLSPRAVKLLLDLHAQYRGHNNGDLSAAWSLMRVRGWTSKDQLTKALRELLASKFVGVSRRPRAKREPVLYFLTFLSVDNLDGKLDIKRTPSPSNEWRTVENKSLPRHTGKIGPQHGAKNGADAQTLNKNGTLCPAPRADNSHSLPRHTVPFLDLPCGHHLLEVHH